MEGQGRWASKDGGENSVIRWMPSLSPLPTNLEQAGVHSIFLKRQTKGRP